MVKSIVSGPLNAVLLLGALCKVEIDWSWGHERSIKDGVLKLVKNCHVSVICGLHNTSV